MTSATGSSSTGVALRFCGAARNVTGSSYIVEARGRRLLVDCGLFQERSLQPRNWNAFPVPAKSISAVLLTHAHLDHCGLLPKLVKDGFSGPIYCTAATADIARIIMLDSAKIQQEDAAYKQKRHAKEGRKGPFPIEPLYTMQDAEAVFPLFEPVAYDEPRPLGPGLTVSLRDAGHILGSASVELRVGLNGSARTLVFSGDVGRRGAPILRDPARYEQADYIVCESTYGNRVHKSADTIPDSLARIVSQAHAAGGNIIIPSFAVERTQELLFHLSALLRAGRIPHTLVFVDSPMATKVTELFRRHLDLFDEETTRMIERGEHPCDFPGLATLRTADESKAINHLKGTAIIIAGSGMCTGGRIKHHLANNIERPESTVLFVGYQAEGTLGRLILEHTPEVRIFGQVHPVKARVEKINGFSAHADRDELVHWLSGLKKPPRTLFVTHGEPEAATSFAQHVHDRLGWNTTVPAYGDSVTLD